MNFCDALNNAVHENSGILALYGLGQASRIANSQVEMAKHQKLVAEREEARLQEERSERDRQNEQQKRALEIAAQQRELLQRAIKDAQADRDRQQFESNNLRKFRSVLVYCGLLLEQADPYGFAVATLEVLFKSLESLSQACHPTCEDIQKYHNLRLCLESSRAKWCASHGAHSCLEIATEELTESELALADLEALCLRIHQQHADLLQQSDGEFTQKNLLLLSLFFAGSPFNAFCPNPGVLEKAKKCLSDRSGCLRCTDDDVDQLKTQSECYSSKFSSAFESALNDRLEDTETWVKKHSRFKLLSMVEKVSHVLRRPSAGTILSTQEQLLTFSFSGHLTSIFIDVSMQAFLGLLEQARIFQGSESCDPESSGPRAIPQQTIEAYHRFRCKIEKVDKLLFDCGKILQLWAAFGQGKFLGSVEQGIRELNRVNREAISKRQAEREIEKSKRLLEFMEKKRVQPRNSLGSEIPKVRQRIASRIRPDALSRPLPKAGLVTGRPKLHFKKTVADLNSDSSQQDNAWCMLVQSHQRCLETYRESLTPSGKLASIQFKGYLKLEDALKNFHTQSVTFCSQKVDDRAHQLSSMIAELGPSCELAGICLAWPNSDGWAELSLSDWLDRLKPRPVQAPEAYVNVLCAMAAADGEFCNNEKWTIRKWIREARLENEALDLNQSIEDWSWHARNQSLLQMVAQSIADCDCLVETPYASKVVQAVGAVLRSDGRAMASEIEVFQSIRQRLGL